MTEQDNTPEDGLRRAVVTITYTETEPDSFQTIVHTEGHDVDSLQLSRLLLELGTRMYLDARAAAQDHALGQMGQELTEEIEADLRARVEQQDGE